MNSLSVRLQGTWSIVGLEMDGRPMPGGAIGGAQIVMDGDRFTTTGMGGVYSGTFVVDEIAIPNTIDLRFTEGEHAGKVSPALLKLDDNCLTICLALAGGTRPLDFVTSPGSGHVLETLQRVNISAHGSQDLSAARVDTPTGAGAAATPAAGLTGADAASDLDFLQGEWTMASGQMSGEALFPQFAATGRRHVAGSHVTVSFGGTTYLSADFTLDATTEPKSMDFVFVSGPNKGAAFSGIYRLDTDLLHVCYSPTGAARPQDFTTTAADGHTYGVWRRA